MKRIAVWFAIIQIAILAAPAFGQDSAAGIGTVRTVTTESWVEEWDAAAGQWVRVAAGATSVSRANLPTITKTRFSNSAVPQPHAATRYALPSQPRLPQTALGQYGPFIVTSPTRAAMIGSTDRDTPHQFDAMVRDFPNLAVLEMVEAPGTSNDIANLAVGRRIRAAGISTHVPRGGSVRSGAVELFLAGVSRSLDDGAQFAVHSWLDNHGREPDDFAADDPANRLYLDYYKEMGMSEARARQFYAMTNSVPHSNALWLRADEMRYWLRPEAAVPLIRSLDMAQAPALQDLTAPMMSVAIPMVDIEEPVINYFDLSGISLMQLHLASLDSQTAFP